MTSQRAINYDTGDVIDNIVKGQSILTENEPEETVNEPEMTRNLREIYRKMTGSEPEVAKMNLKVT